MSRRTAIVIATLSSVGIVACGIGGDPRDGGDDKTVAGEAQPMKAYVAALPASELLAAYSPEAALPAVLPSDAGLLALVGSPGELYFSLMEGDSVSVCILRTSGHEAIWSTRSTQRVELVGAHGSELFLKFVDQPYTEPIDGWKMGGFFGLDVLALHRGIYPLDIDADVIAMMREDLEARRGR